MYRTVQKIHRVAGLVSIVIVVFLAATGVLLAHSEGLTLYERYVESPFFLSLYGEGEDSPGGEDFIEGPPSWERVLTALHSGRLLGVEGSIILDLSAVVLIVLCLTGPYIWIKKLIALRINKGLPDEDALVEKTEQLMEVKSSARGFIERAGQLHDISEHVLEHIKGTATDAEGAARDAEEIEGHLVELDSRMHGLIERIKALEKDVART
jgi:hypothetical protein